MQAGPRSTWRWLELIALFGVGPVALAVSGARPPLFPLLWLATAAVLVYLWRDPGFDRAWLWRPTPLRRELPRILGRFVVLAGGIAAFAWAFRGQTILGVEMPERLFGFVRERPGVWAVVMVLYPVLSVYPQNLVYRAFFVQRYGVLLGSPVTVAAVGAIGFGVAHAIFPNWIAPLFTAIGGWLFMRTYQRSESLVAAPVEHALYGCFLFPIGLGRLFYYGFQGQVGRGRRPAGRWGVWAADRVEPGKTARGFAPIPRRRGRSDFFATKSQSRLDRATGVSKLPSDVSESQSQLHRYGKGQPRSPWQDTRPPMVDAGRRPTPA